MTTFGARTYDQAAVVVPAHNEQARLPACLRAVLTATLCTPVPVLIVVVLDATDDDSAKLAGRYGPDVHFVSIDGCNVGPRERPASAMRARSAGTMAAAGTRPQTLTVRWIRTGWCISSGSAPTWCSAWCGWTTGITIPPTLPIATRRIMAQTATRTADTRTFTEQTWVSLPPPIGASVAFGRCRPVKTSTW